MEKPGMIITGAAGFLGSQLVRAFEPEYTIFALDRRPPETAKAPTGPGIHWFEVNISAAEALGAVFQEIRARQPISIVLHLAGYYNFSGENHPEYERTNVIGMRNVLECAGALRPKRLIFTSSVAACRFPPPGGTVNEQTPPLGIEPYSCSKRAGEELLAAYRDRLPANIVRLAAVFTDWCEYEPLSNFLNVWGSQRWDSRVLGGKGEWAIPYLHMRDLVTFFQRVVARVDSLEPLEVLLGSPNGCTSHRDLFQEATRALYGHPRQALPVPRPVAQLGIRMREQLGRVTGRMPFERSWMGNYIDRRLDVDAGHTHGRLDWTPDPNRGILAVIPTMVRNLRARPEEWHLRHQRRRSSQLV